MSVFFQFHKISNQKTWNFRPENIWKFVHFLLCKTYSLFIKFHWIYDKTFDDSCPVWQSVWNAFIQSGSAIENTSHRTGLTFVQDKTLAWNGHFATEIPSRDKKQKVCKNHTATFSYQSRKRGNPEGNIQFNVGLTTDASIQRRKMFLHALIRSSVVNTIPPTYPSYCGFYASLAKPLTKHKAYYHKTSPNPPKKGVFYDIMQKCKQAAE